MSGKSDYLENALLDHVLGGAVYSRPGTIYLALYTVSPGDAGGGTEVAGTGYARVALANDATTWAAASAGSKSNAAAITFPTAGGSWGTVVALALLDDPAAGNLLYWGPLVVPSPVASGQVVTVNSGGLIINED